MLGAIAKISGQIGLDTLKGAIKLRLGKLFSDKIIDANIKMAERGFEEVKGE